MNSATMSSLPTFPSQGYQKEKGREQGIENLLVEIMSENFPNLVKERDIQVQKCRVRNKMNPEADTKTHHN